MTRLDRAAGLLFVAVVIAGSVAFPHAPGSSDPATVIAASLARHRASDLAGDYTSLLAQPLLLVFLVGLAARVQRRGAALMLTAAAAAVACELAATAVEVAITAGHMPATTAGALYQVATRLFYVNVLMLGVAVAAGALAAALPRWVTGLGVAAGAVLAVSGFAVAAPHGPLGPLYLLGFLLLFPWVAAASLAGVARLPQAGRTARNSSVSPGA